MEITMKNCNKVFVFIILLLLILNAKYYDKILQVYRPCISNGYTDCTSKTINAMNRSEAAAILSRLVDKEQKIYPGLRDYGSEMETISLSSAKTLGSINGTWRGAGFDIDHVLYTAFLDLKIQNGILETMDWQVSNPGFKAKITGIDKKYIYIKILEADGYPADWELKAQDKIQYEYYSKYELRLIYNGTTCVFYRQNDLTDEQVKKLKHLVNINWVAVDNNNLSVSFSYFDIELYDAAKQSDDKIVFAGRTYFNAQDSIFDSVPDITIVKESNPIWPGMEEKKIDEFHYQLSEDGKVLTLICDGKEATFRNWNE